MGTGLASAAFAEARSRGAVAQLGERLNGIQEVDGSIPFSSTNDPTPVVTMTKR